ncbi:4-(cytidine 5'-diphospho)-2-C-methyl-D-erythritol kinase [Aliikangiella maris]|uniref:4-(Cytidine 5'-diphospho)-2-C-methyl-D-erythritol kinase n=2 Tax=Aliikangiella maris TaxID=3162458 RepID=A0ABV2BSB5_9GAMM
MTKTPKRWASPAKLNLFLQVIGRRTDGYHLLQSIFQLLEFGDELEIHPNESGQIELACNISQLATADNLVVRAANALKQTALAQNAFNQPQAQARIKNLGASIKLYKNLPAGGGLGGGSSNCATTLLALNHLWKLNLDYSLLAKTGLSLGADVPFFVHGQNAFVEGIGEKLTTISLPECWYLVIQPGCHIATAKIFSNPLLTRNSKAIRIRDLNALELPYQGVNTLQAVACQAHPEVQQAVDWLKQFSPSARMTGSGSCVFAAFDNEQEVRKIAAQCEWSHFVTKGINLSPVHIDLQTKVGKAD